MPLKGIAVQQLDLKSKERCTVICGFIIISFNVNAKYFFFFSEKKEVKIEFFYLNVSSTLRNLLYDFVTKIKRGRM